MECCYCYKHFSNAYTLKTHQNRARSCINIQEQQGLTVKRKIFTCAHCNKILVSKIGLEYHEKICKVKLTSERDERDHTIKKTRVIIDETEDKIEQLASDLRNHKEEIEYEVKYTTFSTSYVDVDLLLKDKTKVSLYKKLTPNGLFKINNPIQLNNEYYSSLLNIDTEWRAVNDDQELFEGRDRKTNTVKYTATRADLIFGSNSELRAIAEVYASNDAKEKFVKDFVKAWTKVMNLDRFDVQ